MLITDKVEEIAVAKKEEALPNEKIEAVIEKIEEAHPYREPILQSIEAKLSDSPEILPAPEPAPVAAVAKNGQDDEEEEEPAEPRRSFLSRLFGKSSE